MKKIVNKPENVVAEMLSGYLKAYPRYYERIGDMNAFTFKKRRRGKVSLVIGGGSGHEPLFSGFCGTGMADAVAVGNIFASPDPQLICETAKAVDEGRGVLFIYGNYAGDNMNFDMGEELCACENIRTAHVRVWDDCASAPKARIAERRGIAGDVYVIHIAAAACDAGLPLEEVVRIAEKARDSISTIGLATAAGTHPETGGKTFELPDGVIEYGMGLHGEPGVERTAMKPAAELTGRMYSELIRETGLKAGEEIAVLVNSLGSTTMLELCIVNDGLQKLLKADGIRVHDCEIKSYCTCQEMSGFSVTFLRLDDELKKYYDAPVMTPYYARSGIEQ